MQPSGATGGFSRVLGLLEAAVAAPGAGSTSAEIATAEANVTRLHEELAVAVTALLAAQSEQQQAVDSLARTESALRRVDEIPAVVSPGPSGLRSERNSLARAVPLLINRLFLAQEVTAAARTAWRVKHVEYGAAVDRLDLLREELWSKLNDPTFRSAARVLIAGPGGEQVAPSRLALSDVPASSLDRYKQAAQSCPGLSWTVLAAIGSIESDHGRSVLPGVHVGANFAGAMGPMQFLAGTWAAYGADGNGDGKRDVYNPDDAVLGAANYLCANGAGGLAHLADAIWAYNHADWYVDDVLVLALRYGSDGLASGFLPSPPAIDVQALVDNPNLVLTDAARGDLLSGAADPRIVQILASVAVNHRLSVSVIKTGHSTFVEGTDRVSNHYYGRGIDIYAIDGVPVSQSNTAALEVALAVLMTAPDLRPIEFGSPWPDLGAFPGTFSDASHRDHLHLGWSSPPAAPVAPAPGQ